MEHRIILSKDLLIAVKAKRQDKNQEPTVHDSPVEEKPEVRFVWFPNEERYIALYGMEHSEAV